MKTYNKTINDLPILIDQEMTVLKTLGMREELAIFHDLMLISAESSLRDKALDYERENGLGKERISFTRGGDLFVWFANKYGLEIRKEPEGPIIIEI